MIRLVALDVDGTLTNSRGEITAPVREAIRHFNTHAMPILIASGRNTQGVESVMAQLGLNGWCISSGGALTIYPPTGQVLERHLLERGDAEAVIRLAREANTGILLEQALIIYWEGPQTFIPDIIDWEKIPLKIGEDLLKILNTDPLKLVLVEQHAALMEIEARLRLLNLNIHLTYSAPTYLEITRRGVTKGAALTNLARHLKIPLEQVAAIGDGENDISMFKAVGLAIAMGNAAPHVQQAADLVAPSNDDDGLVWALKVVEDQFEPH